MLWNMLIGNLIFMNSLIILKQLKSIDAHGRMFDPPGRGSMWRFGFDVPENYNDMSNYCGGLQRQWEQNNGKCGVCGDAWDDSPREHEPGGKYATGIIGKTYQEGEEISITIDITANHYGYFEFRLCQNDEQMAKVTQDCFDKNLLLILNNNEEQAPNTNKLLDPKLNKYKYFLPNKNNGEFRVRAQLPEGVSCKFCILQWRYHAGNNFGKAGNGRGCLGCSQKQEEFYNCADVEIVGKSNGLDLNDFNITATDDSNDRKPSSGVQLNLNVYLILFNFLLFIVYLNI